jgi:uncharacterized membrane protein
MMNFIHHTRKEFLMFDLTYLHPMVVHFPIALLIVGLIADIIGVAAKKEFFTRAAFYLLVTGTIGVAAAYFSGESAGEGVIEAGSLKAALENHEDAAQVTLLAMGVVALIRIGLVYTKRLTGIMQWVSVLLFAVGVLTMVRTAHYGGQLVYKHAAGVQLQLGGIPADTTEQGEDEEKD